MDENDTKSLLKLNQLPQVAVVDWLARRKMFAPEDVTPPITGPWVST